MIKYKQVWYSRNKDGDLYYCEEKPMKNEMIGGFICPVGTTFVKVDNELLPELTFENSPKKGSITFDVEEPEKPKEKLTVFVQIEPKKVFELVMEGEQDKIYFQRPEGDSLTKYYERIYISDLKKLKFFYQSEREV